MSVGYWIVPALLGAIGLHAETLSPNREFEHFMKDPSTVISWSKPVATIESSTAKAVLIALAAENPVRTPSQMRGIRIDLVQGGAGDSVFYDEASLEGLSKALESIAAGAPMFLARFNGRGSRCFGSEAFRTFNEHPLSVSQCTFQGWNGLSVNTARAAFQFPQVLAAELSRALTRSQVELRLHRE